MKSPLPRLANMPPAYTMPTKMPTQRAGTSNVRASSGASTAEAVAANDT